MSYGWSGLIWSGGRNVLKKRGMQETGGYPKKKESRNRACAVSSSVGVANTRMDRWVDVII